MTRADLPSVTDRYSQADIDAYYEAGLWRRETLFDVVDDLAERRPDDVFATDGTTALTFGELREPGQPPCDIELALRTVVVDSFDQDAQHVFLLGRE